MIEYLFNTVNGNVSVTHIIIYRLEECLSLAVLNKNKIPKEKGAILFETQLDKWQMEYILCIQKYLNNVYNIFIWEEAIN